MGTETPSPAAVAEEKRRVRELRCTVDLVCSVITQSRPTRGEAEALVAATRRRALELFPGKGETFDLILAPRFARLIQEHARPAARVIPFPDRSHDGDEPTSKRQ